MFMITIGSFTYVISINPSSGYFNLMFVHLSLEKASNDISLPPLSNDFDFSTCTSPREWLANGNVPFILKHINS